MGLSIGVAPLLARFYGEPRLTLVVIVASTSFVILGLRTVPYGLMERAMDFRYLALPEIGRESSRATDARPGVARAGLLGSDPGPAHRYFVGTVVMIWRDPRGFSIPRLSEIHDAVRLSYHLVVARCAWYAYSNSDYVVVGRRLGSDDLAPTRWRSMSQAPPWTRSPPFSYGLHDRSSQPFRSARRR